MGTRTREENLASFFEGLLGGGMTRAGEERTGKRKLWESMAGREDVIPTMTETGQPATFDELWSRQGVTFQPDYTREQMAQEKAMQSIIGNVLQKMITSEQYQPMQSFAGTPVREIMAEPTQHFRHVAPAERAIAPRQTEAQRRKTEADEMYKRIQIELSQPQPDPEKIKGWLPELLKMAWQGTFGGEMPVETPDYTLPALRRKQAGGGPIDKRLSGKASQFLKINKQLDTPENRRAVIEQGLVK